MPNLTLSIPPETKKRMDAHPHVKWSSTIRAVIEQKLNDFEEAERLAKKTNLSMSDFKDVEQKINTASRKHAEALLRESHR